MEMLQKGWVVALLGGLNYLAVTAALITPANLQPEVVVVEEQGGEEERIIDESWSFFDPDVDQFLEDSRQKSAELAAMEARLKDWETRLLAEAAELRKTTQSIHRVKMELETFVIWLTAEEEANLRKLGDTYSALTPDAAAVIFKELPDEQAVNILMFMKPESIAPVLEGLSRLDAEQAGRAAQLTEALRRAIKRKQKA